MNMRSIFRRNLLLLGLLSAGSLFFFIFSLAASYYRSHPDYPPFLLRINEVCTVNPGVNAGEAYIYEDYIELYNPSDQEISLEHVFWILPFFLPRAVFIRLPLPWSFSAQKVSLSIIPWTEASLRRRITFTVSL